MGVTNPQTAAPKGILYESDPEVYSADELGQFEIAITPGETWAFVAYTGHHICYGDAIDVDACKIQSASSGINLNDETKSENVYVEVENIAGGESLIFFDVTERHVDIGLFGACKTPYTRITLEITPANGCGSTVTVQGTYITASSDWEKVVGDDDSRPYRRWPYAAMDYYIELDQVPNASWLGLKSNKKR